MMYLSSKLNHRKGQNLSDHAEGTKLKCIRFPLPSKSMPPPPLYMNDVKYTMNKNKSRRLIAGKEYILVYF